MNRLPRIQKNGNRLFTYEIEMEGIQYDLMRASYDRTSDITLAETSIKALNLSINVL